jgi:hypothetical protein
MVMIADGYGLTVAGVVSRLYNSATWTFAPTASLNVVREYHTAALLNNGAILVAGGGNSASGIISSSEL